MNYSVKIEGKSFKINHDTTLMEALRERGFPLVLNCGGLGVCRKCLLEITSGKVCDGHSLKDNGKILACKSYAKSDLVLRIPPQMSHYDPSIVKEFLAQKKIKLDPLIKVISLELKGQESSKALRQRIIKEFDKKGIGISEISSEALKNLEGFFKRSCFKVDAVVYKNKFLIDFIENKSKRAVMPALAVDIGTTTVVLNLFDLRSGRLLADDAFINPQVSYGADIITRILSARDLLVLKNLSFILKKKINESIKKITSCLKISSDDIYIAGIAGNTTMLHFFFHVSPDYLRRGHSVTTVDFCPQSRAGDIDILINPEGRILSLPSASSYLGADILAGLLALPDYEEPFILADIGTNAEVVLGWQGNFLAASCSAGPAFEGAGIKFGMHASKGAIYKLEIKENDDLDYSVIGSLKPAGICGTGLIEAVYELFKKGIVNKRGKFIEGTSERLRKNTEEEYEYVLVYRRDSLIDSDISVTQSDIDNFILAKGALFSGIYFLCQKADLKFNQIKKFYIAGGLGNCLDIEKSVKIGLFPDIERNKFFYLGNAALKGIEAALLSGELYDKSEFIKESMVVFDLSAEDEYMREFTASLFLPHTDQSLFSNKNQNEVKAGIDGK